MTTDKATQKLQSAYTKLGGKSTIPWATILQMILSLLAGCTTPVAKRFGKNHPLALEYLLTQRLKEGTPPISAQLGAKDTKLVAQAGVAAFNAASVADIDSLRQQEVE